MRKLLFTVLILIFTTACSLTTGENVDTVEQEPIETAPTEKERDAYLKSNEFILEYEHTIAEEYDFNYLTIKMNDNFIQMKISEQYLYLVDFYETYNENYGELLPNGWRFINRLFVYIGEREFPTYEVTLRSFGVVAVHLFIDREIGDISGEKLLLKLDKLDKEEGVEISQQYRTFNNYIVGVDENSRKVCFLDSDSDMDFNSVFIYYGAETDNIQYSARTFSYKDILESEVIIDGETVTKTSRTSQVGGAILGGIFAGGVGAVIGGLSGKTASKEKVKTIQLKIIVNDIKNPLQIIPF